MAGNRRSPVWRLATVVSVVLLVGCRAGVPASTTTVGSHGSSAAESALPSEAGSAPPTAAISLPTAPTPEPPPLASASIAVASIMPPPEELSALERSNRFWDPLTYSASGYVFHSLGEMAEAADLVVTGRIIGVRPGRQVIVSAEDPEATADFVTAKVAIDEILKGTPESREAGEIDLELFLPDPRRLDDVRANVPQEQQLMFLFHGASLARREGHPPEYQEQYRYTYINVSAQGILRSIDGKVKRLPPAVIEDLEVFPTELDGVNFAEIVSRVQQILRRQG